MHGLVATTGACEMDENVEMLGAPPVVRGGWVILASGETLTALRAADGVKSGRKTIAPMAQRPAIDGDRLYVPRVDGRIIALDLKSGAVVWDQNVGINPTEPLVYDDRVVRRREWEGFRLPECAHWQGGMADVGRRGNRRRRGRGRMCVSTAAMDNLLRGFRRSTGARELEAGYRVPADRRSDADRSHVAVPGRTAELPALQSRD